MKDSFGAVRPDCHPQCESLIFVPNYDFGVDVGFLGNFDSHVNSPCYDR